MTMRIAIIAAIVTAFCSPLAAQDKSTEPPSKSAKQWESMMASMADLVGRGYSLVSVTSYVFDDVQFTIHYLSRRGAMPARCLEAARVEKDGLHTTLQCQQLVRPYASEPDKSSKN